MAFTLRITQGSDAEEVLSFDGEVRMGRTADNDVVIKDPSSSRSHARVYEEDGRYFVEDLKSANGTTLNDRTLKAPVELKTGDRIAICDVVLEFDAGSAPSSTLAGEDDEEDANATLLKPERPAKKPVSKPAVSAVAKAAPRRPTDPGKQVFEPTAAKGQALKRPPTGAIAAVAPAPIAVEAAPLLPTAADRARERRELQRSSMGRVQVLWNELPRPTQIVVGVVGLVLTVGLIGMLISAVIPRRVVKRSEPMELVPNGDTLADSFGEGEVDYPRPDMKSFTFTFASPTAIVGVLHYQARDCGKDEVSIELNGSQVATIPADTVDVDQRQLELVLPATQMRISEPNELVFDNVTNPPANDPWRIWNLWVEVIPVPQMSADEAGRRAKDDIERAARLYDLRGVGAMNLFRSWKQYRDAWLLLEATPDRPADLLMHARARMREIRPELDKKCALMLVSYQREMNQKWPNIRAARKILQDIPSYFEKEHPCYGMSRGLMANLEDLSEVE